MIEFAIQTLFSVSDINLITNPVTCKAKQTKILISLDVKTFLVISNYLYLSPLIYSLYLRLVVTLY